MTGRDKDEPHRVSSPLELLFDLTFVVAVAQVAGQLAHTIAEGTALDHGVGAYLMVFFAIWWAWMNFTWFASAYDTDDVPYRLLTMLQMGGVLVLAAGVPAAFADQNYLAVTIGYLIMRVGLVAQWVRAGVESPGGRRTAFRYAAGIVLVQLGWVARLLLPGQAQTVAFVILAIADVCVPIVAERSGITPWHPHHIAERYGLFTIILLGESVSAATVAVQAIIAATGVTVDLVIVAGSGLILLFAMWWLYFKEPSGEELERRRDRSFVWGYGHYVLFAAIAAVGAAIEVAVEFGSHRPEVSPSGVGFALAVPVAVFIVMLQVLHALPGVRGAVPTIGAAAAILIVLGVPFAAPTIGVPLMVASIAAVVAALTGLTVVHAARRGDRRA